jgi:hypothetical protein
MRRLLLQATAGVFEEAAEAIAVDAVALHHRQDDGI